MEELIAGKYVEKKSRFYTHLYSIDSLSDVDQILKKHRSDYKKANHHCYAYIIEKDAQSIERTSNDGEVGNPGRILLEMLKKYQLSHHMIVVSRVFGGIKLGVGGVSKAFKKASDQTINYYLAKQ